LAWFFRGELCVATNLATESTTEGRSFPNGAAFARAGRELQTENLNKGLAAPKTGISVEISCNADVDSFQLIHSIGEPRALGYLLCFYGHANTERNTCVLQ
jgi:hypothetical protein